ncbi:MAG: 16S rRNA (guanine(527)-N(7))-methyltransferase RsmG [Anaerolineae bacterium]|nr:16S rRNA (guanine(527)-N(7))-methyltransferase RsmG [Anaerolineae bacterium]
MDRLIAGAAALGLSLSGAQLAAFEAYYHALVAWNAKFNLTTITTFDEVQTRHFVDSLSVLRIDEVRQALAQPAVAVIDVGAGAGFPGLPLKIACPSLRLTLLESTGKKVTFLEYVIERLDLENTCAIKARAEELGHDPAHRASYDLAFARAVADMAVLAEYTLPFLRPGGWLVAPKGEGATAEAAAAAGAIHTLGGVLRRVVPADLPGLPASHALVAVEKVSPTPHTYPRRPGVPAKNPLCQPP